ncbi:MAG: hypothetical protein QM654_18295 [Dysgonamonadaceae bacterium]
MKPLRGLGAYIALIFYGDESPTAKKDDEINIRKRMMIKIENIPFGKVIWHKYRGFPIKRK